MTRIFGIDLLPRVILAVVLGLIVTGAALQTGLTQNQAAVLEQHVTRGRLQKVADAVEAYRGVHGSLPRSLRDAPEIWDAVPTDEQGRPLDG